MTNTIQVRRGDNASLPVLNPGEFGWSTDSHQLYIGDGTTNHEIGKVSALTGTIPYTTAQTQVSLGSLPAGSVLIDIIVDVTTAFDDSAGNYCDIGTSGVSDKYVQALDVGTATFKEPAAKTGTWGYHSSTTEIFGQYVGQSGDSTQGSMKIVVLYVRT